jgi:hypothetical protein
MRKLTDQPATRIAYCLLMLIFTLTFVFVKSLFISLPCLLKTMSNLIFLSYGKVLFVFRSIKNES